MKAWPDGGIEGDDLQEIAVKHGMLAPETLFEPCGEWCNCNAGVDVDGGEWERGVECFRRTALLRSPPRLGVNRDRSASSGGRTGRAG